MKHYKVFTIVYLLILILSASVTTAQIDLEIYNGNYVTWFDIPRGGSHTIEVIISRRFSSVEITVSPSIDVVEVIIRDPYDRVIQRKAVQARTKLTVNIDVEGIWKITIEYPHVTATSDSQRVSVEIIGKTPSAPLPSPAPTPMPRPLPWDLIGIVGIGGAATVIVLVAVLAFRKKPTPHTPPPPPPPTAPPITSMQTTPPGRGEETIVMERTTASKETDMVLAILELSDGRIIPITSPRQIFGRADFEKYVAADALKYVSRRHFMIYLEPGGFFIEDLGSANGTIVNGSDIRGKGKVPLKSGDIIEVGGVIRLKFKTGA
ncbi:MAG: FHA domain-containing protein [Desulfurococcaceae archaeon]